jgi:uncharacterized membrane protein (UPF0127 family)
MSSLLNVTRVAGLWLVLATASCAQAGYLDEPLERFPQSTVEIVSGGAHHRFDVWIADTPARHARGLMWVRSLDPERGMLFLYEEPAFLSYWMQNTYVSLDLMFVAADGRIINIVERATPLSIESLPSRGPATMVLEVVAGTSERLGIRPGDRLVYPAPPEPFTR